MIRQRMAAVLRSCLLAAVLLAGPVAADVAQPVRDGFVPVVGGPVWYRIVGSSDAVPLLVLHGGPGGTSCGFSLLEPIATDRPLVRYDQLGTGRSGRPDDPGLWTVERYVDELHALRQSLGLARIHLLGHSWGGSLAASYVLAKGTEGVVSLTLSSPLLSTPDWIEDANALREQLPPDVQATLDRHEAAGTTDDPEYESATAVFYARHVWGGERRGPPPDCRGAPGNDFIYEYMWGPTEFYATGTLVDYDVTGRLGELDLPVLLIAGEFDEARPERMREFQALIPGSRLEIIADAAHATISRQTDAYLAVLREFLAEAESRESERR
ncbi:MAG: proline iminopeptidase-family hydrolase [Gammaproteobacteria bacterium]|nr:proline iminopeptidase-family hydrolase [Gammaproteobacteria bacterium]MDH4255374.1 proline iminopeptidase-family hydrolase [Gammaproteobacteria bacterium]MDH5261381.1 proline iminopeptidase-family hydrolase [Gammaproteobacteria bacterium]